MVKPKHKEFRRFFQIPDTFMDVQISAVLKRYVFDVLKFDDYMIEHYGYEIERDGSLHDFVRNTFGEEAAQFLCSLLSPAKAG